MTGGAFIHKVNVSIHVKKHTNHGNYEVTYCSFYGEIKLDMLGTFFTIKNICTPHISALRILIENNNYVIHKLRNKACLTR